MTTEPLDGCPRVNNPTKRKVNPLPAGLWSHIRARMQEVFARGHSARSGDSPWYKNGHDLGSGSLQSQSGDHPIKRLLEPEQWYSDNLAFGAIDILGDRYAVRAGNQQPGWRCDFVQDLFVFGRSGELRVRPPSEKIKPFGALKKGWQRRNSICLVNSSGNTHWLALAIFGGDVKLVLPLDSAGGSYDHETLEEVRVWPSTSGADTRLGPVCCARECSGTLTSVRLK